MWWIFFTLPIAGIAIASQAPFQQLEEFQDASEFAAAAKHVSQNSKFLSIEELTELPLAGTSVANDAGDLVLTRVSEFSVQKRVNFQSLWISSLESKEFPPLEIKLPNGGETFWLNNCTLGYVVSENGGAQELYAISLRVTTKPAVISTLTSHIFVGSLPEGVSASSFKYSPSSEVLMFSADVWPDSRLETVKKQDEEWDNRGTSALVYEETFVRYWDHYILPKKASLFSVKLSKMHDRWIMDSKFKSILKGTGHEVSTDFDISGTSVVYTAKDITLPQAMHTRTNVYIVDIYEKSMPRHLTSGKQGKTSSPIFSKQGDKVAWTEMDEDGTVFTKSKIVLYDLKKDVRFTLTEHWDRSVDEISFSYDDKYIVFTAKDKAHGKIFTLRVPPTPSESDAVQFDVIQTALTQNGSASGIQALRNGRIVYSKSDRVSPKDVHIVRNFDALDGLPELEQITYFSQPRLKEKEMVPPVEFWFEGSLGRQIQGWIYIPPGFKESDEDKWPALLRIHGGPQLLFEDTWSNNWNSLVWSHKGYFIVEINISGSSSYGQNFTDSILEDWGGKPFVDLRLGWKYFLDKYPQVNRERLVAFGHSFGGYAINWIQGHPEYNFGFKAVVWHDGVFDLNYDVYSTDELFFVNYNFGGKPWEPKTKAVIAENNPANFVANWSIPQLIIHGSKDYRLAETEAIATFHALKQLGVRTRLVIFPDEGHVPMNQLNIIERDKELFAWYNEFV